MELLTNFRLKLLAIGFALALWSVVAYTANPTTTRTYALQIAHNRPPNGLVLLGDLQPVTVTVVATADAFRSFDPHSLQVSADFSGLHVGRNIVPLHLDGPPSMDIKADKSAVVVDVDHVGTVSAPVEVVPLHSPADGFHVVQPMTLDHDRVTVQGPQSLLAGIHAVATVDLAGLDQPKDTTAPVVIQDADKNPVPRLSADPPQVLVHVTIQADAVTETKVIGFTLTGQPACGYVVTNAQVTPLTVSATGLAAALAGLQQIASDPVDVNNAKSDFIKTVRLRPPAGVTLGASTAQVHVFVGKTQASPPPCP